MKHKENGLALSVSHLLDRFPFLSLRDIFPRTGGSLSSKGEPLAKPQTLYGLPKPLTLGEVALRKQ